MNPNTQSVCKHCQRKISKCRAIRDSTRKCKGYIHTATGFHFCNMAKCTSVAEPASTGEPETRLHCGCPDENHLPSCPTIFGAARPSEPAARQIDKFGRCLGCGLKDYHQDVNGKPCPFSAPQTSATGEEMEYQVAADKLTRDDWRVEAINYIGEGECFVTIFSGPNSENRAKEYADWKNNMARKSPDSHLGAVRD